MKKPYTHSKGFNVASLKGVSGLYFLQKSIDSIEYIGKCEDDFKKRMQSHCYGEHGKLSEDMSYLRVVIVDPTIYPLHVLEHLFIWYFFPQQNHSLWFFSDAESEKEVKLIAKENNLHIRGSLLRFIQSFESILIEREWDENNEYKKYGGVERLASKKVKCTEELNCPCYRCSVKKLGALGALRRQYEWEILMRE